MITSRNPLRVAMEAAARERLLDILRRHRGNVTHAAIDLRMEPRRVYEKLRRFGFPTRSQRDRLLTQMRTSEPAKEATE